MPVVLFLRTAAANLSAELVVLKKTGSDGKAFEAPTELKRVPLNYVGSPIDSLALTLTAPQNAGVYSLDLQSNGTSIAERQPDLLVQRE